MTGRRSHGRLSALNGVVHQGSSEWLAELKVNGEIFSGKGGSAAVALQDLQTGIMKAAVKHQRRGRAPERVRVAATLLHGGQN